MKISNLTNSLSGRFCSSIATLPPPPRGDGMLVFPWQGYPQQYVVGTHLYTWVKTDNVKQIFLSKKTTKRPT